MPEAGSLQYALGWGGKHTVYSTASRVFYRKPNKGWHSVAVIPWRGTKAESEDDLTAYAEKHKMKLLKEDKNE